jgi:protein-S-isoprenylcysteine O-methyltransferase Ste14
MTVSVPWLRLRAVWFLVLPFFWFARPTPEYWLAGLALALVGLWLRAWAAGVIHKDHELTMTGPYAFTRNPLYLGSLLLGFGMTMAGGRWIFPAISLVFFALIYGRTMKREEAELERLFGERFRAYAAGVPVLLPRLRAYRPSGGVAGRGFSLERYLGYREYEALLGAAAGFAILAVKLIWV